MNRPMYPGGQSMGPGYGHSSSNFSGGYGGNPGMRMSSPGQSMVGMRPSGPGQYGGPGGMQGSMGMQGMQGSMGMQRTGLANMGDLEECRDQWECRGCKDQWGCRGRAWPIWGTWRNAGINGNAGDSRINGYAEDGHGSNVGTWLWRNWRGRSATGVWNAAGHDHEQQHGWTQHGGYEASDAADGPWDG